MRRALVRGGGGVHGVRGVRGGGGGVRGVCADMHIQLANQQL